MYVYIPTFTPYSLNKQGCVVNRYVLTTQPYSLTQTGLPCGPRGTIQSSTLFINVDISLPRGKALKTMGKVDKAMCRSRLRKDLFS